MQPQSALVGPDGGAELDAVAPVHVDAALIVVPGHPEADHALGLHESLDDAVLLVLRMLVHDEVQALQHLQHRLVELPLVGITGDDLCVYAL